MIKTDYREWVIDSAPEATEGGFNAQATIERGRSDGDDDYGRRFTFKDLGHFATATQAIERAKTWTIRGIDENA
jgi:hypothetical protein